MFERIIRWALEKRALVLIAACVFAVWGGYSALRMPIDVFPDLTAPTVTVVTEAHGMAPEEVESLVTFPIETALNGAPMVRRVRSATAIGISVVWVEFEWDAEIYRARQVVSEKLQLVAGAFPEEVEKPILAPISSVMGEILFLAVTSDRHTPMDVRLAAETQIRRRLLAVPGIAQVTPIGGDEKQYQILIDPEKLALQRIGLGEVTDALRASNQNASAGFLTSGGQEYLVRGIGRIRSIRDIEDTVVAVRSGQPVLVRNVAEVRIGPAVKRGEGSFRGKPAVVIGIQKQPAVNTLELTRKVDAALDEIQKTLPEGMTIHRNIFRQSDFIEVSIRNVEHALRDGGILVLAILMLFLANVRAVAIALVAIPLSFVAAALGLQAFGSTINTMTLGGLAIAIGAIVDDAVIDVENTVRRLRENAALPEGSRRPALPVILEATLEIRPSIVFATLIILLAFVPLFFLSGIEGRLMRPLGAAYVISLFASLVVSLVVTPALCYYLLSKHKSLFHGESATVRFLKERYRPLLSWAIDRPKQLAVLTGIVLVAALVAGSFLGRSFLPTFHEGTLTISVVTLPGTNLEESDKLGRQVEEILLSYPEVETVARRTGRAELDEHAQGVEAAELDVTLRMQKRSKEAFLADLRRSLTIVPGTQIVIGQPISHRIDHMLSGTRANLAVKIFGPDLLELRRIAEEVKAAMRPVPGIVDLNVDLQSNVPIVRIAYDRPAMARYGLTVEDLSETLEAAFLGHAASTVFEGQNAVELVVRYRQGEKTAPADVGDTLIDLPDGNKIPLKMVAQVVRDSGPNVISRENVQRKIVVMSNVEGRALGDAVKEAQRNVEARVKLPAGYYLEYGGQFQAEREASRRITVLGILVVLVMGVLLTMSFGSVRDALLIMFNLPLALIGGIAGVFVSGGVVSIASLIGFVALFGIAARNGIMLVSHIRHLMEKEGVADFREAVVRGSMERLSPILMTALCAGLGLIPLALSGGKPGSEIQTPMAIVILFGLVSSTVLNMLLVPAFYHWALNRGRKS